MPELPEVETVRRSLLPVLVGRRVVDVRVLDRRLRTPVPTRRLRARVAGRRVEDVRRRSKYLLIDIEGEQRIIVHLGMSGRLVLRPANEAIAKHTHVIFALDDGRELRFRDPRRFGLVDVVAARELAGDPRFRELGPEPLSPECTAEYFLARSRGLRKPVKNFLMDAKHVVGIGNIYANEALFLARVHPQRAVGRMSRATWTRVTDAVKQVLERAIESRGTTLNDFEDGNGHEGSFQVELRVYGRKGEACTRCGGRLKSKVLAGRSTFYCGKCQR